MSKHLGDDEPTLTMRALKATEAVGAAPSHIGKAGQFGGIIALVVVGFQGVAPTLHQIQHPDHAAMIDPWPIWLTITWLAVAVLLLAGAETLAKGIRAIMPIFDRGKSE